jgi:predicted metal-dependent phosphoesterase TrpH
MPPRFDLQSHSIHSDGTLAAAAVVERAGAAGVELLALTDHDTVDGVSEALRAGERHGVRVVPAIEISALDLFEECLPAAASRSSLTEGSPATGSSSGMSPSTGTSPSTAGESSTTTGGPSTTGGSSAMGGPSSEGARELHILGYLIDHGSSALTERLEEFLADRERRTMRMADALRELGLELDEDQIDARRAAGQPIGRPHLAEAALACATNAPRLRAEQIDDIGSLIRAYLVEGRPAFRTRETPTVGEAVAAIHDAGGVAVWAHPFWDISAPAEVVASVERLRTLGIDGVEAFYITHTREQTELLVDRCAELDLLTTGSADFHGPENRLFSRFLAFDTYGLEPNLGSIADVRPIADG